MRRASLNRFFILMFLQVLAANMVHPVTPTFLKALSMPSYLFGAAYAAMSCTNFLFCPFWGRASDSFGRIRTMTAAILGYAGGQLLFLYSTTIPQLILARLIAGLFSGGCTVCFMAYVADVSEPARQGRSMAVCAALTSAGTAAGYLAGGVLGNRTVQPAFLAQFGLLCLTAAGVGLLLQDGPHYEKRHLHLARAVNPLSAFLDAAPLMDRTMMFFLLSVFAACFAGTAYDNAFNYYIKDQFAFPPAYNGYIYAAVGLAGIAVNMTLGMWLQRNTSCRTPLTVILGLAGGTLALSLAIGEIGPYIGVNMAFYVLNSLYLPLQQALVIRNSRAGHGQISGVFSSVRAVGMVTGSLSAGLLYELAPRLPMAVCAAAFGAAACLNLRGATGKAPSETTNE